MIYKGGIQQTSFILTIMILFFLFITCENHIIQRSASDYFFYHTGNWWQYVVHDTDTVYIEVEAVDTLLGVECHPVSRQGFTSFFRQEEKSISEYMKTEFYFNGNNYTVIEDFVTRIELPLVNGNTWRDSLCDSILVAGQTIKASCTISGSITDFYYNDEYNGDVYSLEIIVNQQIISLDTTIATIQNYQEIYAPAVGLIEFCLDGTNPYTLVEYQVE